MKDIFELQWQLNTHTLSKIGLNYSSTISDPESIPTWLENYRKALSAELAELIEEVLEHGTATAEARMELVDMLHFLVSLSHLTKIDPADLPRNVERPTATGGIEGHAIRAFLALDKLQNCVKWKWWAGGGGYRPEAAKAAVMDLWGAFAALARILGMAEADVKELYKKKNRINFERLEAGYTERVREITPAERDT